MNSFTCPECRHTWEEEVVVPSWYETLLACEKAKRPVPPLKFCEAWIDENDAWHLVAEMVAVVETYWDPPKKKSPWGMFKTYVSKELRLQSERTATPQGGGMLRKQDRY